MPEIPAAPWGKLNAVVQAFEPLTRMLIALSLTYCFIHLAFTKEITGDSVNSVFLVILGFLFGNALSRRPAVPPANGGGAPIPEGPKP